MDDLFARVRPMVGEALSMRRVAILGTDAASVVVEYLAACGVQQWVVIVGNGWFGDTLAKLSERYGDRVAFRVEAVASVAELCATDLALVVDDATTALRLPMSLTRLAVFTPNAHHSGWAAVAMVGEKFGTLAHVGRPVASWAWATVAPLMALMARALLLRDTPFAMTTWEAAWASGQRFYAVGLGDDPTGAAWEMPSMPIANAYHTPMVRRGTLLVVGLGSLGSVAAWQLAHCVERLVLVDGDCVEVANLVRQRYSWQQLGTAKAVALAEALRVAYSTLQVDAVVAEVCEEAEIAALIAEYGVSAALVTTGTVADFAVARALRSANIPHVVGRCYARARFWEAIVVDGDAVPSYEQVRRAVALGPTPSPTPEEVAAYGAVGELVAEPATAMECGWAAMWLARLVAQLLVPATLREQWLLARMAAEANCFVGGLVVELGEDGAAYGVRVPGMVHAWSLHEVAARV